MAKAKQQVKGSKPSYMTTYEAADFLGLSRRDAPRLALSGQGAELLQGR